MCKSKKILKLFSLFATLAFVLLCMTPAKVEAMYEASANKILTGKNQLVVDPTASDNSLVVTIQYQYGVRDIQVYICDDNTDSSACGEGTGASYISAFKDLVNFQDPSAGMKIRDINRGDGTLTVVFTPAAPTAGTPIREYANGSYRLRVLASFCNMRNAEKTDCASIDNWTDYEQLYSEIIEIDGAFTGNSDVNNIIARVLTVVNDYVIPILWVIMGILLIVRGVILAIGIVKASDEAEVRASKIKGLVWLAVGVLAGYAITIGASWVMSVFGYGGLFS